MGAKMAVEDDPLWKEWCDAFDELVAAAEQLRALLHLPDTAPNKRSAWAYVERPQRRLNQAANKIAPTIDHDEMLA
jgi:hypothetical protein